MTQMMSLLSEIASFDTYHDFRRHQEGRQKKREQHGRKADGRDALVEDGKYFEELAERLNFEDVDPESQLPASFEAFLHR